MKDIFKSKGLISFILFMVGIICFNSFSLEIKTTLENNSDNLIILNEK